MSRRKPADDLKQLLCCCLPLSLLSPYCLHQTIPSLPTLTDYLSKSASAATIEVLLSPHSARISTPNPFVSLFSCISCSVRWLCLAALMATPWWSMFEGPVGRDDISRSGRSRGARSDDERPCRFFFPRSAASARIRRHRGSSRCVAKDPERIEKVGLGCNFHGTCSRIFGPTTTQKHVEAAGAAGKLATAVLHEGRGLFLSPGQCKHRATPSHPQRGTQINNGPCRRRVVMHKVVVFLDCFCWSHQVPSRTEKGLPRYPEKKPSLIEKKRLPLSVASHFLRLLASREQAKNDAPIVGVMGY